MVLLIGLTIVVFGNSWGTPVTDVKPEVYFAPGAMLRDYLGAWTSSPYLGSANFNVGLSPVVAVLAPGAAVGLSPEVQYKVFHVVLWGLAGWGASRALRELSPSSPRWAGLCAAVFYVANPYAVVGGSTLAVLLPYVFLPWMLVALVRAVRDPASWRWPAAFGLAFFAMSGMNVAVVPIFQLLMVPIVAVVVGRSTGLSWLALLGVLSKCGTFVLGVSLYWLVPALSATTTGLQVTAESETIEGIAQVSSLVEVLRGMGMWSLYGSGPDGPWQPGFASYLANPLVVLVTLAWPVGALLSLVVAPSVLRRAAAWTIGVGAVVLVGFFPGTVSTPLAALVDWVFDTIPPLVAFRTTNKAGSIVALVFALLLGNALPRTVTMLHRRRGPTAARSTAAAAIASVAVWVMPAVSGNLYPSPIDVPTYWQDAATAVDARGDDSRVLFLPGQVRASYRWTGERVDDVSNSLIERDAVIPYSLPNASAPGANFLAAFADLVASDRPGATTVSTMARYLGSGDILLRHDTRWENENGPRPAATAALLAADSGLVGLANYGRPGENVVGPAGASLFETDLPPLQHYGVREATSTVSARTLAGSVTVAGDAWAFEPLARTGRVASTPVVWLAHDSSADELEKRLGPDHRLVITDTNRRQAAIPNRLTAGYGPLLEEDSAEPVPTRVLGSPDDQTVLRRTGPDVTASQVGAAFYDTPYGQPDNALDGDDSTSWLFGDFSRAAGVTLDVRWSSPQTLGSVSIRPSVLGPVHIDTVTLTAGGTTRVVRLPDSGVAVADLGGVVTDALTLRVDGTRGEGFSLVGIAELDLPGDKVQRVARAPVVLDSLYGELDAQGRSRFDRTPLDVSFTRVANGAGPSDDSETQLLRDFALPSGRQFTSAAQVVMLDRSDAAFDRLYGATTDVRASSSGTYFDNPDLRASRASDGDEGTAWIPGGDVEGEWWQIRGPRRSLESIQVEQRRSSAGATGRTASRVRVEVDGRAVATARLRSGSTEIELPPGTVGATVRLVILDVEGPVTGLPPQFTTIDAGAMTDTGDSPVCTTVAEIDGEPLRMRPLDPAAVSRSAGEPTAWAGCSTLRLGSGEHTLRPRDGWRLDQLDLSDRQAEAPVGGAGPDLVTKVRGRDVDQVVTLGASDEPVVLKIGQSWDPRWRATVEGVDLGEPSKVDGWSSGWILPASETTRSVHVEFAPQRAASLALGVSILTVIGAAGLWLWGFRRRVPGAGAAVVTRGSDAQTARERPVPSLTFVVVAVGAAVVGFGVPGLLGVVAALVLSKVLAVRASVGLVAGASLLAIAGAVQVVSSSESWGGVDSTVPSASMWPHWLAIGGLVVALFAALSDPSSSGRTARVLRADRRAR